MTVALRFAPVFLLVSFIYATATELQSYKKCTGVVSNLHRGLQVLDATTDVACSTNRAVGYAVGRQFTAQITKRISAAGAQLQKAISYTEKVEGQANLAALTKASSEYFPQYWEELEGIAEGSGVPKELIVLLNFRQELAILSDACNKSTGADDCSDVMVSFDGPHKSAFLGHNEDNTADTVNTTYFVQAKLNGRSWTAYTYAGELSSAAWGFNDAGISFTLNAVYAKEVKMAGLGRNFVSRSILDAASVQEAVTRITLPDQATGHNINLIGLDEGSIYTIETGPGSRNDIKRMQNESYFHANVYLRLNVPQLPGPSSEHREARAAQLPAPRTRSDILRILGDTEDAQFPIWRSGSDGIYTLCTAFFDLQQETVEIFFTNPKEGLSNASASTRLHLRGLKRIVPAH